MPEAAHIKMDTAVHSLLRIFYCHFYKTKSNECIRADTLQELKNNELTVVAAAFIFKTGLHDKQDTGTYSNQHNTFFSLECTHHLQILTANILVEKLIRQKQQGKENGEQGRNYRTKGQ